MHSRITLNKRKHFPKRIDLQKSCHFGHAEQHSKIMAPFLLSDHAKTAGNQHGLQKPTLKIQNTGWLTTHARLATVYHETSDNKQTKTDIRFPHANQKL